MKLKKKIKIINLSRINNIGLKSLNGGDDIVIEHNCKPCFLSSQNKIFNHSPPGKSSTGYCDYSVPIPIVCKTIYGI